MGWGLGWGGVAWSGQEWVEWGGLGWLGSWVGVGPAPGRRDLHRKFGIHSVAHVVAYADGYVLTMRHAWYPSRAEDDQTQTQAQDPDPCPGPDAADPDPDPGPSKILGQLLGDGVGVGWRKVLGPVWVGGWTNDFATPPGAIWPEISLRPAPGRRDLHRKTPAPVWPKSRSFGRDALAMDAGLRENRAMAVGTDGSLSTIPGDPAGKSIAGTSSPLCRNFHGSGGQTVQASQRPR